MKFKLCLFLYLALSWSHSSGRPTCEFQLDQIQPNYNKLAMLYEYSI